MVPPLGPDEAAGAPNAHRLSEFRITGRAESRHKHSSTTLPSKSACLQRLDRARFVAERPPAIVSRSISYGVNASEPFTLGSFDPRCGGSLSPAPRSRNIHRSVTFVHEGIGNVLHGRQSLAFDAFQNVALQSVCGRQRLNRWRAKLGDFMSGPNLIEDERCPFCIADLAGSGAISVHHGRSSATVACPVCGTYEITGEAIDVVAHWSLSDDQRMAIAFAVRRMTDRPATPLFTSGVLRALRETAALPAPEALLDEAVLWIGRHSKGVGQVFQIDYREYRAILGTPDEQAFDFVAAWMLESGLFAGFKPAALSPEPIPLSNCTLTPAGWTRYAQLNQSQALHYGFMAMKYGDPELDAVVEDHFVPEVGKTGFDLRRLDQGQPAGLIDDQLRVMIRTSRFVVCDLTHGNRGAYWEAGFAEGLGKPVIYTCRKDVFDNRQHDHHPHFDTNHMVTVLWDPGDVSKAAIRLKDTVRATLPSEAKLED